MTVPGLRRREDRAIDGEGYDYFISPYHQTVNKLNGGTVDRTVDVHGRSLAAYRERVSRARGEWREWFCTGPDSPA